MRHPALLDRKRAALAVIDMQEAFSKIIPDFGETASRIALMVEACKLLNLPIVVTEQYPKGLGRTVETIARHLPEGVQPIEKLSFSACGAQEFDTRLRERVGQINYNRKHIDKAVPALKKVIDAKAPAEVAAPASYLLARIAFEDPQTQGNAREVDVAAYEQIYRTAFGR